MRRRGRLDFLTTEQSTAIMADLVAVAATGAKTAAHLFEIAETLAQKLDLDAPDLMARLKEIRLLIKTGNKAVWLAWKLIQAGVITHPFDIEPARQDPPVQVCPIVLTLAA